MDGRRAPLGLPGPRQQAHEFMGLGAPGGRAFEHIGQPYQGLNPVQASVSETGGYRWRILSGGENGWREVRWLVEGPAGWNRVCEMRRASEGAPTAHETPSFRRPAISPAGSEMLFGQPRDLSP